MGGLNFVHDVPVFYENCSGSRGNYQELCSFVHYLNSTRFFLKPEKVSKIREDPAFFAEPFSFGVCTTKTNHTPPRRRLPPPPSPPLMRILLSTGQREERGESPMGILNGERDAIIILSAAGVFKN